jgi:hypothetical protein
MNERLAPFYHSWISTMTNQKLVPILINDVKSINMSKIAIESDNLIERFRYRNTLASKIDVLLNLFSDKHLFNMVSVAAFVYQGLLA